jgi:ABC-type amino acid transport substrate-binding protein
MAFSEPYLRTGQQAMIHQRSAERIRSANDLNRSGLRIGVEQGSTGGAFAEAELDQASVIEFSTLADATDALLRQRVDAVIHDGPTIAWTVRHDRLDVLRALPGLMTDESIAWALDPQREELLAAVNAALADMRADGTLDRLFEKWLGEDAAARTNAAARE